MIGRFEDGTPLALAAHGGMADPVPNDFTYDDDARGARCPLGAHVRRMNARTPDPATRVVLARRGQGYGVRLDDPADDDLATQAHGWRRPPLHGGRRAPRGAVRGAATRGERR